MNFIGCHSEPPNLFKNPSFEQGKASWFRMKSVPWQDFEVTDTHAHSGKFSAYLPLRREDDLVPPIIWGVIQKLYIPKLPHKLSFWYRIENWQQSSEQQYMQIVVMMNGMQLVPKIGGTHMHLRYILAGMDHPLPADNNTRYRMAGPKEPLQDTWIYFETDLRKDFLESWGWYPEEVESIGFFFEARYEDPLSPDATAHADVYLDDFRVSF